MPTTFSEERVGVLPRAHKKVTRGDSRASYRYISRYALGVASLCATTLSIFQIHLAIAQNPDGDAASKRLIQERPNDYRGGKNVGSMEVAKQNMKELFKKILIEGAGDGKADKWYSPHLRDISGTQENRDFEAGIRGRTAPFDYMFTICLFGDGSIEAACPVPSILPFMGGRPGCRWHEDQAPGGGGPNSHRPWLSCFSRATTKYQGFTQPSNFKMCCVPEGETETASSEYIAAKYPDGDGWAGLWEYYYPTLALGWENDRTTSMIVDQGKVQQCLRDSDTLMEEAQGWVTGAINRNLQAAGGAPSGNIQKTVQDSIRSVRPKDQKLRFTDSLQSEGLTMRVNLAAMDPDQRRKTAERFCMRPEQFDKLMDPAHDPLQLGGGPDLTSLDNIPVWANYCRAGVELMTNPRNSALKNIDGTPTDFRLGMQAWDVDKMYCQKMNLTNVNMFITGLGRAALQSPGGLQTQASVGYTCLEGGKLNGSMVPVELYRHAAVERRTAITDHALGFLIAGGLAPGMTAGQRSYYKRFEPQPYSRMMRPDLQTFIGTSFQGGETNELGKSCPSLSGENYRFAGSKSDRLYISDVTNKAFDQEIVETKETDQVPGVNRYREEWGKDPQSGATIAARGLDKESQNYAAPFRIFATCPKGFKRWRPQPTDGHNEALIENVNKYCREENFGGRP